MHSKTAIIASGVLTVACFLAAVNYHVRQMKQRKKRVETGDDTMIASENSKRRMKYVFAVSTVLFAAFFVYKLMMHKKSPSSSYTPSSSMLKYQHDDDFTRRVNEATSRLRTKLKGSSSLAPSSAAHMHNSESSRLAARASAEISSFIANNV